MESKQRLIDANVLTDAIEGIDWYHVSLQGNLVHGARSDIHTPLYKAEDIYHALENAPTVDAVEVVRCKDCFHLKGRVCCNPSAGMWVGVELKDNDFCSYGERRTDG